MIPESLKLLFARRFGPLFATLSLGALNDNLFKQVVVLAIMFRFAESAPFDPAAAATVAAAVFIAPFFLLSASAGQLADARPKARLIRHVKLAELGIMTVGAAGLLIGDVWILLGALAAMGAQSAIFGPAKYASLPALLRPAELLTGNGIVQGVTFLTILSGMIAGGLILAAPGGVEIAAVTILALALAGVLAARGIPETPIAAAHSRVSWNLPRETWRIIHDGLGRPDLRWPLLGTAFFWLSGLAWVSLAPVIAERVLGGAEIAATLIMAAFAVGVGVGALGVPRLLKGEASARYAPLFAALIAVFAMDAVITIAGAPAPQTGRSVAALLQDPITLRLLADLVGLAAAGGAYVTPLHTLIQKRAPDDIKARIIAANNVIDTAGMATSAALAAIFISIGMTLSATLAVFAGFAALVSAALVATTVGGVLRAGVGWLVRALFRLRVRGRENLKAAGPRAVIAPNHASFLDGLLLAAVLPGRPVFAVNLFQAQRWWVALALRLVDHVAIDPTSPMAARTLSREVARGRWVVIFPEGRITPTGGLMKVYPGPGVIADHADAPIVPVRIDGAERSVFSRLGGKIRRHVFPRITIDLQPPVRLDVDPDLRGRPRRRAIQGRLQAIVSEAAYRSADTERTLWRALLDARRSHGGGRTILDDADHAPMTYTGLVRAALALGHALTRHTAPGDRVGVLLPTSRGGAITTLALQAHGRVPAMLNFTAGTRAIDAACRLAEVRTILTSRRFVERARLEDTLRGLTAARVVFLEDVRPEIGLAGRLRALVATILRPEPVRMHPDDPAVVLFTSGTEGLPKGVVLSHRNLLANSAQLRARVPFGPDDKVLNVLPIFHAFGLTALYLALTHGVMSVAHPSPLHYRYIPEIAYARDATIMFATDSFLRGYARAAQDFDFTALRYVFAGAEKVRAETRREWSERFGVRVLEGYGVSECAPVVAVNTPIENRPGSVGKLLPGIDAHIRPVDGVTRGGELVVSGANIMLGYLRADTPGELDPPPERAYATGDIVEFDADGYLHILGRAKRFAKVAGEMVSLAAVEDLAATVAPESAHAAAALPDGRKGERIVLLTESEALSRDALADAARRHGHADLSVPATVIQGRVPLLGSGKVDHASVKQLISQDEAA